jgi:hypothetical protein
MYSECYGVIAETLKTNWLILITIESSDIMPQKHALNAIINQSKMPFSAANTLLTGGYRPSRILCAELQI